MEIICDTNIWYKLGNNEISIQDFGDNDLIATRLSIDELGTSENLLDIENALKTKKASKAIFQYAKHIQTLGPLEFILHKSGNELRYINDEYHRSVSRNITSIELFGKLSKEN